MINRYYNSLEIIGKEKQIQAVKEFIHGGQDEMGKEIYFDFNTVEKMPENISNGYADQVKKHPHPELIDYKDESGIWNETLGQYNNWCYENWGCEYPPFDQEMEKNKIIRYTTEKGRALGVIEKLSALFPKVILVIESLCGSPDDAIYHFKKGKIIKFVDYDYFISNILFDNKERKIWSKLESELFPLVPIR